MLTYDQLRELHGGLPVGKFDPPIIYISGPISGTDDYEARFRSAESFLHTSYPDATVINPINLTDALPDCPNLPYDLYMDVCLAALAYCNAIFLLHNWEFSNGAKLELLHALDNGLDVIVQE